jgi:hypothetical protein
LIAIHFSFPFFNCYGSLVPGIDKREQRKNYRFYDDLTQQRLQSGDAVAPESLIDDETIRMREVLGLIDRLCCSLHFGPL